VGRKDTGKKSFPHDNFLYLPPVLAVVQRSIEEKEVPDNERVEDIARGT
jgi:hypothetical protein